MKENLSNCPVCGNKLKIVKYACDNCNTEINGDFTQDNFSNLTHDQKNFMEIFILKRGSIKEIEKQLGISYPTVRSKLDDLINALGHKVEAKTSKMEILEMLNSGEITSEEATRLLSQL